MEKNKRKRTHEQRVGGIQDHHLIQGGLGRQHLSRQLRKFREQVMCLSSWGKSTSDKGNTKANVKAQR